MRPISLLFFRKFNVTQAPEIMRQNWADENFSLSFLLSPPPNYLSKMDDFRGGRKRGCRNPRWGENSHGRLEIMDLARLPSCTVIA